VPQSPRLCGVSAPIPGANSPLLKEKNYQKKIMKPFRKKCNFVFEIDIIAAKLNNYQFNIKHHG